MTLLVIPFFHKSNIIIAPQAQSIIPNQIQTFMREIIPMGFPQPLSKILPISLLSRTEFIGFWSV